ncbi:unnamed protein product [Lactuca virosa]|uniref:Amino acid permease/ SLC12A domain-containing protein n=1 Tax=Lactuca virosa TaxID=75947 RepID=A0AAU9P3V5_9ASTR|nr:unnamed protein product [Lactuca virosa]
MGLEGNKQTTLSNDQKNTTEKKSNPKLTLLPLIALIFYEVSGGPFGVEDSVNPEASSTFITRVLNFPHFLEHPRSINHSRTRYKLPGKRRLCHLDIIGVRPFLGGLHIVGFSAVLLASFSLLPFAVMGILSIPKIRPKRWVTLDFKKVQWRGYFNSMFWNLNYWDKASTLAGEVEDPSRTFPKALYGAVIVVVCSYLIPLLAGTGSLESDSSEWSDGYFAEVGFLIGGSWLKWWIQAAAAMSNLGLFEAEMSSDAFQLLGMSEIGMLPSIFASRSKYGTPTISILCSATGVIFLSWMSFQEILEFLNFLYAIGMLFEFAAFIKLRLKKPDLHRPYKVPLKTFGATMLCVPPATLLVLVMCLASLRTFLVTGGVIVLGFFLYPFIIHAKNKNWAHFVSIDDIKLNDCDVEDDENVMRHMADEAGVRLLSDSSSSSSMEKVSEIQKENLGATIQLLKSASAIQFRYSRINGRESLAKNNFLKFLILTIGRENLPLHNRLITSIVKNATLSKTPPPTFKKFTKSLNVKIARGQRNSLQSYVSSSPRKSRSPRDRKLKDRFSPLGPNGKSDFHQSPTELHSLGSRPPIEVLSVEDGEEVVSGSPGIQSRSPVTAPLGISLSKTRKSLYRASVHGPANASRAHMCQNNFELPDSRYLRGCLRQKLEVEGISVSEDCANLLNVGLDAYLKRLIEPCISQARSRLGQSQSQSQTASVLNGPRVVSSVLDLSVAMECDPRRLGVDWSTQMEKLRLSTFEE